MTITIVDLPDDVLIELFSYIRNIRQKVSLLRVCKKFNQAGRIALKTQSYRLECKEDYSYQKDCYSNRYGWESPVIPLNKLLKLAPKLTHFTDHRQLTTTATLNEQGNLEPFDLSYAVKIELHLSFYSLTKCFKNVNDYPTKLQLFLDNSPNLVVLKISIDTWPTICKTESSIGYKDHYMLPFSPKLKAFIAYIDPLDRFSLEENQLSYSFANFFGIINGCAPNLEMFSLDLGECVDLDYSAVYLIEKLTIHCPNLKYLEIFHRGGNLISAARFDGRINLSRAYNFSNLSQLIYLSIQGVTSSETFWSRILSASSNLKFLIYDEKMDKSEIIRLINQHCPQVYFDHEEPFKAKEEFEEYIKQFNPKESWLFLTPTIGTSNWYR